MLAVTSWMILSEKIALFLRVFFREQKSGVFSLVHKRNRRFEPVAAVGRYEAQVDDPRRS